MTFDDKMKHTKIFIEDPFVFNIITKQTYLWSKVTSNVLTVNSDFYFIKKINDTQLRGQSYTTVLTDKADSGILSDILATTILKTPKMFATKFLLSELFKDIPFYIKCEDYVAGTKLFTKNPYYLTNATILGKNLLDKNKFIVLTDIGNIIQLTSLDLKSNYLTPCCRIIPLVFDLSLLKEEDVFNLREAQLAFKNEE